MTWSPAFSAMQGFAQCSREADSLRIKKVDRLLFPTAAPDADAMIQPMKTPAEDAS